MTSSIFAARESQMAPLHAGSNPEQVVDTMIGLTRMSHRVIIAGND